MMQRININDELCESGYNVLLISSFGADLNYFEKMILRKLKDNDCTYVGLYIDQIFQDNLAAWNLSELGVSYVLRGVHLSHAFHPKMYLLLGQEKAKIIIGSGNLTPSGFVTNLEFFRSFKFDRQDDSYLSLIKHAYEMFTTYHEKFPSLAMENIFEKANQFTYLTESVQTRKDIFLLDNIVEPIFLQLKRQISAQIESVDIIVPYFDQNMAVIDAINQEMDPMQINIYMQNRTNNFNRNAVLPGNVICKQMRFIPNDQRRYHGKIFAFRCHEEEFLLYGSTNCSEVALLKSLKDGGNVESVIVEKAPKGTLGVLLKDECEFCNIPPEFESIENTMSNRKTCPIQFIEALKTGKGFVVTFETKLSVSGVLINDLRGKIKYVSNHYEIKWDKMPQLDLPVFEFDVITVNGSYQTVGWLHDLESLAINQSNINKSIYSSLKDDPYLSDFEHSFYLLKELYDNLVLTNEDINKKNIPVKSSIRNQEKVELQSNAEISDNIDDYFVEEKEDQYIYGSIGKTDVLQVLIRHLLANFSANSDDIAEILKNEVKENKRVSNAKFGDKLAKQLKRFFDKFNQGIASSHYLQRVDSQIFVRNFLIYSGFMWNFYKKHQFGQIKGLDFLSTQSFINQYFDNIRVFLQYAKDNSINDEPFLEDLVSQFLVIIVAKKYLQENSQEGLALVYSQIQAMLREIEEFVIPIRETYSQYIVAGEKYRELLDVTKDKTCIELESKLESQFDFYTLNQFKLYIASDCQVVMLDDKPEIVINRSRDLHKELELLCKMISIKEWSKSNKIIKWDDGSKPLRITIYNPNECKLTKIVSGIFYEEKSNVTPAMLRDALYNLNTEVLSQGFSIIPAIHSEDVRKLTS